MRQARGLFEVYIQKLQEISQRNGLVSLIEKISFNSCLVIDFNVILTNQLETQPRQDQMEANGLLVDYSDLQQLFYVGVKAQAEIFYRRFAQVVLLEVYADELKN